MLFIPHYKGILGMKLFKIWMLIAKFYIIRLQDVGTFFGFIIKLSCIFNMRFNLEEKTLDFKIVMKILRFIPKRFRYKFIVA